MSYGFIRDHVAVFPVAILCEVLGVSRSGYYDWARRPESRQAAADRVLAAEIRATHAGLVLGKWRAAVELCRRLEGTRALVTKR
ncbi:hypothetical protein SKB0092_42000 (plasmid) [Roseomonas mucosa]